MVVMVTKLLEVSSGTKIYFKFSTWTSRHPFSKSQPQDYHLLLLPGVLLQWPPPLSLAPALPPGAQAQAPLSLSANLLKESRPTLCHDFPSPPHPLEPSQSLASPACPAYLTLLASTSTPTPSPRPPLILILPSLFSYTFVPGLITPNGSTPQFWAQAYCWVFPTPILLSLGPLRYHCSLPRPKC